MAGTVLPRSASAIDSRSSASCDRVELECFVGIPGENGDDRTVRQGLAFDQDLSSDHSSRCDLHVTIPTHSQGAVVRPSNACAEPRRA